MRDWDFGDKKLRAIRVRPGVGHGQPTWSIELKSWREFIFKAVAGVAGAVAERIASLNHEIGDHAMEDGAVIERHASFLFSAVAVSPFLGAIRQPDEISHCLRC